MSAAEEWEEVTASDFRTQVSEGFLIRDGNAVLKITDVKMNLYVAGWGLANPRLFEPKPPQSEIQVYEDAEMSLSDVSQSSRRTLLEEIDTRGTISSTERYTIPLNQNAVGVRPPDDDEDEPTTPLLESDLPDGQTTSVSISGLDAAKRYVNTTVYARTANGIAFEGNVVELTSEAPGFVIRENVGTADYRYYLESSDNHDERDVDLISVTSSPGGVPESVSESPVTTQTDSNDDNTSEPPDEIFSLSSPLTTRLEEVDPTDLTYLDEGDMAEVINPYVEQESEGGSLFLGYDGSVELFVRPGASGVFYKNLQSVDVDEVATDSNKYTSMDDLTEWDNPVYAYQPGIGEEIIGASLLDPGFGEKTVPILASDIDPQFEINPYIRSQADAERLVSTPPEQPHHVVYRSSSGYLGIGIPYRVPDDGAGLVIGAAPNRDPSYNWYLPSSGKQDENDVELVAIPQARYIDNAIPTILDGAESVGNAIINAVEINEVEDPSPDELGSDDTGSEETIADDSEVADDADERGEEDRPYDPEFVQDIEDRFFPTTEFSMRSSARALATEYDSFDEILAATPDELEEIRGVGSGTIQRLTGFEDPGKQVTVQEHLDTDEDVEPEEFTVDDAVEGPPRDTIPFDGNDDDYTEQVRDRIKEATEDPPSYIRAESLDRDILPGDVVAYDLMRGSQAWAIVYPDEASEQGGLERENSYPAEIFLLGGPGDTSDRTTRYDNDNDGWIKTEGQIEVLTGVTDDTADFNWVIPNFTGEQDGSVAGGGVSQDEINEVAEETEALLARFTELRNTAVEEGVDTDPIDAEIADIQTRIEQIRRLNTQNYTRGDLAEKTAENRESETLFDELTEQVDAGDIQPDATDDNVVDEAVDTVQEAVNEQADDDVVESAVETAQAEIDNADVSDDEADAAEDEVAAALSQYNSVAPDDEQVEPEPEPEPEPESESESEPDDADADDDTDADDAGEPGPDIDASRALSEAEQREVVAKIVLSDGTEADAAETYDVAQSTINRVTRKYRNLDDDTRAAIEQILFRDYGEFIETADTDDGPEVFPGGARINETDKLDEDAEREIVYLRSFTVQSLVDIADKYPVSPSTISRIEDAYTDLPRDDREELETILLENYDYVADDVDDDPGDPAEIVEEKLDRDTDTDETPADATDTDTDTDAPSDTSKPAEPEEPSMNRPSNPAEQRVADALTAGGVPYDISDVGLPIVITRDEPNAPWLATTVESMPDEIAMSLADNIGMLQQGEESTNAFLEEVLRSAVQAHAESVREKFDYDQAFDAADIEEPLVDDTAELDETGAGESADVEDVYQEAFDIVTDNTRGSDERADEAARLLEQKLYNAYPKSELRGGGLNLNLEFSSQGAGRLQGSDTPAQDEQIEFVSGVANPDEYAFFEGSDGLIRTPLSEITPEGMKRALGGVVDLLDMRNPNAENFADITRKFSTIQNLTEFEIEQSTADWTNLFLDGEEYSAITARQPTFFKFLLKAEVSPISTAYLAAQRVYFAVSGFEIEQQAIENDIAGDPTPPELEWYLREAYLRATDGQFDPAAFTYAFHDYATSPPGRGEPIPDVNLDEVGYVTDGMDIPDAGTAQNPAILEDPEDFTTSWRDLAGGTSQRQQTSQQRQQQPTQQPQQQQRTQQQQRQQRTRQQSNQQQIQQQARETTSMSERQPSQQGLSQAEREGSQPEPEPEPEPTQNLSDPPLYEGDQGLPRLTYRDPTDAQSVANDLGVDGIHVHEVPTMSGGMETVYMPGATHQALNQELNQRGLPDAPLPEQEMQAEVQQQQPQQQRQQPQQQPMQRGVPGVQMSETPQQQQQQQQSIPGARTPQMQQQQPQADMDAAGGGEDTEEFPIILTPSAYKAGEVGERFRISEEAQQTIDRRVASELGPAESLPLDFLVGDKVGETILSESGILDIDIMPSDGDDEMETRTRQTPTQQQSMQQQQPMQQQMQQQPQGQSFPAQSLPEQVPIVSSRATMAQMPDTGDIKSGAAEGFVIDAIVDATTDDDMVTVRVSEPDGDNGRVLTVDVNTSAQAVVDMALNGEGQPINAPEVREIRGGGRL